MYSVSSDKIKSTFKLKTKFDNKIPTNKHRIFPCFSACKIL